MPTDYAIKNGRTVMDATTYTGNGTGQAITNTVGFKPDLVWLKCRSNAYDNNLFDSVRGARAILVSNTTAAQDTQGAGVSLTAFNSNGFQLGTDNTSSGSTNNTGWTYVGWQWQAGQGTTSSNTNGSITSTVSVNATAGFSIVTYTNPSSGSSWTVGHGLGVAPSLIITKQRSATSGWPVYHASLGATNTIFLQATNASGSSGIFNNTAPTSSVMSYAGLGTNFDASATVVAYCWAEIAGFSKFGSYTGNDSTNGPFIYTGFRPRWIMIKRTDSTGSWILYDTARMTYNTYSAYLYPNLSNAEDTSGGRNIDILSNGFKCRDATYDPNASGGTYIYAAFAENPFKYANAR